MSVTRNLRETLLKYKFHIDHVLFERA